MNLEFDTILTGRCHIDSDGSIVSITRGKAHGPFFESPDTISIPIHDLSIQTTYQEPGAVFLTGVGLIGGGLMFGFLLFPLVFVGIGVLYVVKARKQGITNLTIRSTKRRFRILAVGDHRNILKAITRDASPPAVLLNR